jgi:hypothetical protein
VTCDNNTYRRADQHRDDRSCLYGDKRIVAPAGGTAMLRR